MALSPDHAPIASLNPGIVFITPAEFDRGWLFDKATKMKSNQ